MANISKDTSLNENNINISLDEMLPNKIKASEEVVSEVSSVESESVQDYVVVLKNINLNI